MTRKRAALGSRMGSSRTETVQDSVRVRWRAAGDGRPRGNNGSRLCPASLERLLRCYRQCLQFREHGHWHTSSQELAGLVGCGPSQLRKDLTRLGRIGTRGTGYAVGDLLGLIERLLRRQTPRNAVLVGTSMFTPAFLSRDLLKGYGYRLIAAFDPDPGRVGRKYGGLRVRSLSRMYVVLRHVEVAVGVLAVPASQAQRVADALITNGVRSILNLTCAVISNANGALVRDVSIVREIEKLAVQLSPS